MGYLKYDLMQKVVAWVIVMIYFGILSLYFFLKMRKTSEELVYKRKWYRTIAIITLLFIVVRIFFLCSDFEIDANKETLLYYQFTVLAYIFTALAFLNIIYFLEKNIIKKTKFIFSIVIIIAIIIDVLILIFFPGIIHMVRYFNYALGYSEFALIMSIYIYLAIKSPGELRKNTLISIVGLLIAMSAAILESHDILMSGLIPPFLSPIVFSVGITIYTYGMHRSTL